eukprot:TRINITY_DN3544_c0_g1_i2.p1 TRINITY_DN3544_c0_g1~~TRINITY_DN3544_c0_g1_i2.p1  ORF type:complete len:484 (-),score=115.97 TRINITY_DN3544_c0_g1_i2:66-1466(-)
MDCFAGLAAMRQRKKRTVAWDASPVSADASRDAGRRASGLAPVRKPSQVEVPDRPMSPAAARALAAAPTNARDSQQLPADAAAAKMAQFSAAQPSRLVEASTASRGDSAVTPAFRKAEATGGGKTWRLALVCGLAVSGVFLGQSALEVMQPPAGPGGSSLIDAVTTKVGLQPSNGTDARASQVEVTGSEVAVEDNGEKSPPLPWPLCVRSVATPEAYKSASADGAGLTADLALELGSATGRGCLADDCKASDRFAARRAEECAHMCRAIPNCTAWVFDGSVNVSADLGANGDAAAAAKFCFLRAAESAPLPAASSAAAADDRAATASAAARSCEAPATEVPPARAIAAVLASPVLRGCYNGGPELIDAARTWRYGLDQLALLVAADSRYAAIDVHMRNVREMVSELLVMDSTDERFLENYRIIADNSRQVLAAAANFFPPLTQDFDVSADVSVPRPARGLLCRGEC